MFKPNQALKTLLGVPAVSLQNQLDDLQMPVSHEERLAWVKKSYERFIEKVLEKEALARQIALDLG